MSPHRRVTRAPFVRVVAACLVFSVFPTLVFSQVGYPPAASPYRDIDTRLRLGTFGGLYVAANDPAGVMPKNSFLAGLQLDVHVGGPGDLTFRLGVVPSERDVLDPTRSAGQRVVGTRNVTLTFADVGLTFHLTGKKSWHYLAPIINASVGIVSDFTSADLGGYEHGSTFAFGYGAGVRYVPPEKRLSARIELGSYLYSLEYPETYYVPAGDGTSVLPTSTPRSAWRNNWTVLLGVSYRLFR